MLALEEAGETQARGGGAHTNFEKVGWIAFESTSGHIGLTGFHAGTTPNAVRHEGYAIAFDYPFSQLPRFFGNIATFHGADAAAGHCGAGRGRLRHRGSPPRRAGCGGCSSAAGQFGVQKLCDYGILYVAA